MACAARPSPRPVKPSLLRRRRLDRDLIRPDAGDRRDPPAHGLPVRTDARRLAQHVTSRWSMTPPLARTRSAAKARNRSDEAPRHCGSLGGKCTPMSPSARAPRRASVRACSTTSPSEWAATPRSWAMRTPPSQTWSPSLEGVDVEPGAEPRDHALIGVAPNRRSASSKSAARVEFDVGGIALEHGHGEAGPLGQSAVVGEASRPRAAARRWASSSHRTRRLAASGWRAAVPAAGVSTTGPSSPTTLIVSVTGMPGTAAPFRRRRDRTLDQSRPDEGRAASWTRTSSGASGEGFEPGGPIPGASRRPKTGRSRVPAGAIGRRGP